MRKGNDYMNCADMMNMPELDGKLILKAGGEGVTHSIRWIYFADCLQCIKNEYRVENYIHGGEFVVLTNRSVTNDTNRLMSLIGSMQKLDIAALGINEGQISDSLIAYCNEVGLPLFELPEKYPLIDLSQVLCQRLVMEENSRNSTEQLLSSIIDAEHLNRDNVYAQARFLNIDLSGYFFVVEFAFYLKKHTDDNATGRMDDSLAVGQAVRRIINTEFAYYLSQNILTQLQTGSVLALIPAGKIKNEELKSIFKRIIDMVQKKYQTDITVGVGTDVGYLEDVRLSRNEAATAIRIAEVSGMKDRIVFFKDQGLYTLISHIHDDRFLDEFVEKSIGKLIHADEVNDGSLCESLEMYLNHNCNVKNTAEAMYIHRNTLNYRLNKIWELLGRECDDIDSIVTLKLAFMIRNIVHRAQ